MKLTAQDLQIGDYFYRPDCIDKVVEIRKNGVIGLDLLRGLIPFSEIKGIPVTPEILSKNGFEKVLDEDSTECYRYYNSAADGYIKITLYDGLDGDWGIDVENYEKSDGNHIVYRNDLIFLNVHQLQQIMRLCGIKGKEIKL